MNVTSLGFLLFAGCSIALYYCFPEKWKSYVLIGLSFCFVASYDPRGILFLLGTSFVIWRCALAMQKAETEGRNPKLLKKRILLLAVVLTAGVLIVLKYLGPMALMTFFPSSPFRFFLPIGLSYYTLQALSYVIDVYWGRIPAEKQYHRMLLFLCFFPQILQGPIGRYGMLSQEFFEKDHHFQVHNLKYGVQLILWGLFKLLVIGDKTHNFVVAAFHSGQTAYGGAVLFGLIMFGFDLYANFSGGIDVMRGLSQCFGITLAENFRQPFFSRSLGEFWRRWHITLGAWMKDYIFFPISMSKPFSKGKKKLKQHVSKKMATRIPIAIANVFVFLLVGLWHGLGTNYLLWGLYNGLILAFSEVMAEVYLKSKKALHIQDSSRVWVAFSLLRTFLIITLGWATDCASTASGSFMILGNLLKFGLTDFSIFSTTLIGYAKAFFGLTILIVVEILHEKGWSIREKVETKNTAFQILFWTALIQLIACLGRAATLGGLMYAGF